MTAPPCKLAPRTQGSSTNHFIRAWTRTKLKLQSNPHPCFRLSIFIRVKLVICLEALVIFGCWEVLISGIVFILQKRDWWCDIQCSVPGWCPFFQSCELQPEKTLAVSGKVNITFVYISPSQNWLLPLAQSILPLKYILQVQPHLPSCTRAFSFLSSGKTIRIDRRQNRYIRCWWTQTN